MEKYSIGRIPIGINHSLISSNLTPYNCHINTISYISPVIKNVKFDLNISAYNSGYTNDYYIIISSSSYGGYVYTGSTEKIIKDGSYTWIYNGKFINENTNYINIKLYNNNNLIDEIDTSIDVILPIVPPMYYDKFYISNDTIIDTSNMNKYTRHIIINIIKEYV